MKWIRMVEHPADPAKRTTVSDVVANDGDAVLGQVRWWGAWRKYAFFPAPNTLYEQDCLRDIAAFCEQRTADHRMITRRRRELEGA